MVVFGFFTTITALDGDHHHLHHHLTSLIIIITIITIITIIILADIIFGDSGKFYWPFLAIVVTPMLRVLLIGHWAQVMKDTVRDKRREIMWMNMDMDVDQGMKILLCSR